MVITLVLVLLVFPPSLLRHMRDILHLLMVLPSVLLIRTLREVVVLVRGMILTRMEVLLQDILHIIILRSIIIIRIILPIQMKSCPILC